MAFAEGAESPGAVWDGEARDNLAVAVADWDDATGRGDLSACEIGDDTAVVAAYGIGRRGWMHWEGEDG
jgi:hypothetical protein